MFVNVYKLTAQVSLMTSFNDSVRLVNALEILAGSGDGSGIGLGWYGHAPLGSPLFQ